MGNGPQIFGMVWWFGMVVWYGGLERWFGMVVWNGGFDRKLNIISCQNTQFQTKPNQT